MRSIQRLIIPYLAAAVLIAGCIALPGVARAHKVSLFAWVEADTVHTVSKFSGGRKVKQGRLAVFAPDGRKLLEGLTNDRGEFAFKIPQKTALRVELVAGAGHKAHWQIPLEEVAGQTVPDTTAPAAGPSGYNTVESNRISDADAARLQALMENALDRKLKPVMTLLSESKLAGPSLTEILGGIGYIIGLVGLAAYFKSRQKE